MGANRSRRLGEEEGGKVVSLLRRTDGRTGPIMGGLLNNVRPSFRQRRDRN